MKAVILAVSLFLPLSFYCVASAQLTKVTVGNNTLSAAGLPAWMAKESGIFRKNGLDVQIVYLRHEHPPGQPIEIAIQTAGLPINDQKITLRRSQTKIPHNKFIVRLRAGATRCASC